MGHSFQELADATMAEMRQATQLARETHFAHRAEEAERAEESIRTAMFDEMDVDYTADDEIKALGAKVCWTSWKPTHTRTPSWPPTSKGTGRTAQQRLKRVKGALDDGARRPSLRHRSPRPRRQE